MCEYCSLNKNFWAQVIDRAHQIRILTPDEVDELYRLNPQLERPGSEIAVRTADAAPQDQL